MDDKFALLKLIYELCRNLSFAENSEFKWEHRRKLRLFVIRNERGDKRVWCEFLDMLREEPNVSTKIHQILSQQGIVWYSHYHGSEMLTLPGEASPFSDQTSAEFLDALKPQSRKLQTPDLAPNRTNSQVMFIEIKSRIKSDMRIGRVIKSRSGKTLYYLNYVLTSLKGKGFKANYIDKNSGASFWVSNCRKDGNDALHPGIIEIDPDAREEYWLKIRNLPENIHLTSFRSHGK